MSNIISFLSNQRGQAALIDSLFFIAIVATICTGLFYFAINYGTKTDLLLNSFYSSDFAMDSLKVVTYINIMRDGSAVNLRNIAGIRNLEYDYLLAIIKEDYAKAAISNGGAPVISRATRVAIANTIYSVLKPFDDSVDYVFYIAKESTARGNEKFLALIVATHKELEGNTREDPQVKRVFYSCDPDDPKVLEKWVFPYVGNIDSAYGKVTLSRGGDNPAPYVIGLSVWVTKRVKVLLDPTASFESKNPDGTVNTYDPNLFNCTPLTEINTE